MLFLQLLVGSEDFDIRVFKEDVIVAEMSETEVNYLQLIFIVIVGGTQNTVYCKAALVTLV